MSLSRVLRSFSPFAAAFALAACCADGKCIKPPPCRPCENPCCLTPVQRVALKGGDHALIQPVAHTYGGKTYVLLSEKGQKDFYKDPEAFKEKGAVRLIGGGRTLYLDINVDREMTDLDAIAATATPYTPAPKP
jgi:hypothetical protein